MRYTEIISEAGILTVDNDENFSQVQPIDPTLSFDPVDIKSLVYLGDINSGEVQGKYYYSKDDNAVIGLSNGETLSALDHAEREQNRFYPVVIIRFKNEFNSSYYKNFPSLKDKRVLQASYVRTLDQFGGMGIASGAYKALVKNGYIVCTDKWQTLAGAGMWKSIAAGTESTYNRHQSSNSEFTVYFLTKFGWVNRNPGTGRAASNEAMPKPFTKLNQSNHSMSDDMIWNENLAEAINTFLFYGETRILNDYVQKSNIGKSITYSDAKTRLEQAAQQSKDDPSINNRILSGREDRHALSELIVDGSINRMLSPEEKKEFNSLYKECEEMANDYGESLDRIIRHYVDEGNFDFLLKYTEANGEDNSYLNRLAGLINSQFSRYDGFTNRGLSVAKIANTLSKYVFTTDHYDGLLQSSFRISPKVKTAVAEIVGKSASPYNDSDKSLVLSPETSIPVIAMIYQCSALRNSINSKDLGNSEELQTSIRNIIVSSFGLNNNSTTSGFSTLLSNIDGRLKSLKPMPQSNGEVATSDNSLPPKSYDPAPATQNKRFSIKSTDNIPPSYSGLLSGDPLKVNNVIRSQSSNHGLTSIFRSVPENQWTRVITDFTKQLNDLYIQRQQSFTSAIARKRAGTAVTWGDAIQIATKLVNGVQANQVKESSKYLGPTTKVRINKKGWQTPLNKRGFGV